jgi:ribosome-associated protein
MIQITSSVSLSDEELSFDFIRASGPGGQNVNKVSTACQMRFNVRSSPSLQPEVKERLIKLAGNRVTEDGILLIEAKRYRTQEQNRFDAIARLTALIQQALVVPKIRRRTRPTRSSSAARVDLKVQRGAIKRTRRYKPEDWE